MNYQRGMASIWAVIITLVIMLGLAGGGYYYLNQKNTNDKKALQTQIDDLNKQISDLKGVESAAESTADTTTDSELVYTNKSYGFSLTFSTKWHEWKVKTATVPGTTATYYIEVPTEDANYASDESTHDAGYASMFAVSVYTKEQWTAAQSEELSSEKKLGEKGNYVFAWSHAQACPDDVSAQGIWDDINNVIASFKVS